MFSPCPNDLSKIKTIIAFTLTKSFLKTIRRYTDAPPITRRMAGELIDPIDVYRAEKRDSIANQRVVIHCNCIGAFDMLDCRCILRRSAATGAVISGHP